MNHITGFVGININPSSCYSFSDIKGLIIGAVGLLVWLIIMNIYWIIKYKRSKR